MEYNNTDTSNDIVVSESGNVTREGYDKTKVLGLDIQISKMLGDVIVESYLKQLSEEDLKMITDYMQKDLFEEYRDYHTDNKEERIKKRIREDWTEKSGSSYWNRDTRISVGSVIRNTFNERVKKDLQAKIEEIVKTKDYQDKIEDMANEIVEYVTEGYKEDLKNSIREKMIGNVMHHDQYYGGINFEQAVYDIVSKIIPNNNNY